jgi:hypothetical protein
VTEDALTRIEAAHKRLLVDSNVVHHIEMNDVVPLLVAVARAAIELDMEALAVPVNTTQRFSDALAAVERYATENLPDD